MHSSAIKNTQIWCRVTNLLITPQHFKITGLNVNQMIWVTLQLELFIPAAGRKNTISPLMALCIINCYAKLCWTTFGRRWGHSRLDSALEETLKWIRECRLFDVGSLGHSVVTRTKSYESDGLAACCLLLMGCSCAVDSVCPLTFHLYEFQWVGISW